MELAIAQIPEGVRFAAAILKGVRASLLASIRFVVYLSEIASRERFVGEGIAALDEGQLELGRPRDVAPEGRVEAVGARRPAHDHCGDVPVVTEWEACRCKAGFELVS